jgi:DNA-binding Lrp family transcriptional regulator
MDMKTNDSTVLADPIDAALVAAAQGGLPLSPRPYAVIADALDIEEAEVLVRLARLIDSGTIKRFGVVVRHQELGYRANAMVVWALPEERAGEVGRRLGGLPFVTLSYRRPRRLPDWPYSVFTMIHGRDRAAVLTLVEEAKDRCDLQGVECAVLFSGQRFKQRGACYVAPSADTPPLGVAGSRRPEPRLALSR